MAYETLKQKFYRDEFLKTTENDNSDKKFDNKKYYENLKHDCNKDKIGDIILLLSKTINIIDFHLLEALLIVIKIKKKI